MHAQHRKSFPGNKLSRLTAFFSEPPRLLSLRSLVGRFFPCNCYSRKGMQIAHDHDQLLARTFWAAGERRCSRDVRHEKRHSSRQLRE